MSYPWLAQGKAEEVPIDQMYRGRIVPPTYDSVLDFDTIDTKNAIERARSERKHLVDPIQAKIDSEASEKLDQFCEEEIEIRSSDRTKHFPKDYGVDVDLDRALTDSRLKINLVARGVKRLNPLQRKTIPLMRLQESLIVMAPTGIGKTYAFLIPAIELALRPENRVRTGKPAPCVIILSNAGTLANQTFDRCLWLLGKKQRVDSSQTRKYDPIDEIKIDRLVADHQFTSGPCDIASATMGKLRATIEENKISLDNLKMLILDEADRMIDQSSFGMDVEFVYDSLPKKVQEKVQVCFFSATYAMVDGKMSLTALQWKMLEESVFNALVCPRMGGYITQRVIKLPRPTVRLENSDLIVKMCKIRELIDQDLAETGCTREGPFKQTIIIFCETVQRVAQVTASLRLLGYKFKPMSSRISKPVQMVTQNELRRCEIQGVVCTNILARGIDIGSIKHTIVMEMSTDFANYTHRIGRVGRDGSGGKATVIIDSASMLDGRSSAVIEQLADFMKTCEQEVPDWFDKWHLERIKAHEAANAGRNYSK